MASGKAGGLGWYPWYAVVALLLAYILSFMDRMALSLLVDPIRHDLGLGDTAMGLLIGFGFALLYAIAGLFLGRVADLGDRRLLIVAGLLVWSVATALCGLAGGFATLLIARIFVGLGEASLSPASYSLIADYFPRHRLGLATGIFTMGVSLGGGLGTLAVSLIAQYGASGLAIPGLDPGTGGWRATFILLALLGVPMLLLMLTIREPRRKAAAVARPAPPSLREAIAYLAANRRVYVMMMLAFSIMTIGALGTILWGPAFFMRVHGLTRPEVGLLFAVALSLCGSAGLLCGGWLSDRLYARGSRDAPPRVAAFALVAQTPAHLVMYLAADVRISAAAFLVATFLSMSYGGLQMTTFQLLAPERLRGLTIALYLMSCNLIGMGLGPLLVALLTDHLFGDPAKVGYALAIVVPAASLIAAAMIAVTLPAYRAALTLRSDEAAAA